MANLDVTEIKQAARGRWSDIFRTLAPELTHAIESRPRHVPCPNPGHASKDGFRLFGDFEDTGGGICSTCGNFPDGIALLRWIHGHSFRQTLMMLDDYLGHRPFRLPSRLQPDKVLSSEEKMSLQERDNSIAARLEGVKKGTISLNDLRAEPARRYLKLRGFKTLPQSDSLRFHPSLYWFDAVGQQLGPFPTLIAEVTDAKGALITIHRTYLTRDGHKAPVEHCKKLMPKRSSDSMRGTSIKLYAPAPVMGVAEGIETAIAVTEATGIPCWSLVSAQLMKHFIPPPGVNKLIVFADKNRPSQMYPNGHGQTCALKLIDNLRAKRIGTQLALPPDPIPTGAKDIDWCDEYVSFGNRPFSRVLTLAA